MPNWSIILKDMDRGTTGSAQLRANNLVDYLELLQVTPQPADARNDI